MNQRLIIIRGAPASGKTTLCERLRDFDKKIVWLSVDKLKPIFSEYKDETLDETNETALVILNSLLERDYSVVMDGIFKKPEHARKAIEVGRNRNIPVVVYQLESSLKTLQVRDKTRKGIKEGCRETLGDEVIESLFNKVENNPVEGAIKLNTENQTMEECLVFIRKNFD